MNLLRIFQEKYFILLAVCILIASLFTYRYLTTQTIFGYDMARDAFHAHQILFDQNIKIIGPGTDIPGLNHGVLWFYVLVIPYFLARQDPQLAVIAFYLLSIGTIPFVYLLAQRLFKDRRVSFISTVIYSFAPLVVPLASWMSNPILCLYVTPPLLLLILSFIEKPKAKKSFFIGILYGILIQSQLANLLIIATIPLYVILLRVKIGLKTSLALLAGLILSLFSYILVEISFGGRGILALLAFLGNHHGGPPKLQFVFDKIVEFFQLTVFPFPTPVTIVSIGLLILLLVLAPKKSRRQVHFLLIWLSNILLFTFFDTGVSHSSFVFIPSIAAGVILVSFVLRNYVKNIFILTAIVCAILFFQVKTVFLWQQDEFSPAAIQRSNTAYRYKQVVDYTYQSSGGKQFTINTVTNPLFINTTWAYLYEHYGKPKYGYMPYWGGKSQIGYPGNMTELPFGTKDRYLIVESTIGIPSVYVAKAYYEEDKVSDLIEEKKFGYVVVQKRVLNNNKGEIEIPEELKNSHVLYE